MTELGIERYGEADEILSGVDEMDEDDNILDHSDKRTAPSTEETSDLALFPKRNPNPLVEMGLNGEILYSNNAYDTFLEKVRRETPSVDTLITTEVMTYIKQLGLSGQTSGKYEMKIGNRVLEFNIFEVPEEHYHIYIFDVTAHKRAEEQIKEERDKLIRTNEKLTKAYQEEETLREQLIKSERLASLGEMAAKIAHEINNPLTMIMAQAQLMATDIREQYHKDALRKMIEKSDEIAQLTRSYMNLGKSAETKMEEIRLRDVVRRSVDLLTAVGQLKHVRIQEEYLDDEPFVTGSKNQLEQAFRNLIINAIHAISERKGGVVKVGTRMSENGEGVTAYVSDNGVGIEPENLEDIFEYYYTTKEEGVGTGLGLPICKEIIEVVHAGEMNVTSTPGEGTEFRATIPVGKRTSRDKRVLIILDEAFLTDTLMKSFCERGFEVKVCNRGLKALRVISDFEPDLVICGINIPELDGFKILEEIRKKRPNQPIIMLTRAVLQPAEIEILENHKVPRFIKYLDDNDRLWETVGEVLASRD